MGLTYTVHPVNIFKGEQFDPAFSKISPNNRIHAIVDPAGRGGGPISLYESGAILIYLGKKTDKFGPKPI
jgi:GST-like protein